MDGPKEIIAKLIAIPDAIAAALDRAFDKARTRRLRDAPLALFLLLPALGLLGTFGFFPLLYSIYLSLFGGKSGLGGFIGLGNYRQALNDSEFWHSLLVTIYYTVGTIPLTMCVSFLVAYLLFNIARGRGFFRTVYFLPYVTSAVASAMIWRALLNPQFGLVNMALKGLSLAPQQWLLEPRGVLNIISGGLVPPGVGPSLALICVIAFDIWHASGFMIVIFLAGLTAIPRELVEAARIDGANAWQVVRNVVIPLLSPTIFFLGIVSVVRSFQSFNSFYALTGNGRGPLDTTQNMTVYIYTSFYENQRWAYGAAVATLLCVAIVALTLIQWRVMGRRVHYQ